MKEFLLAILFALILAGCEGPKDKVVPKVMAKWVTELKPSIDKLSVNDRKLFLGFLMRAKLGEALGEKPIEEGLTIGKIIEQQKAWVDDEVRKEVEARLMNGRFEVERAALKKAVGDLLNVTVLDLRLEKKGHAENQIVKLGFENKGQKDIRGIRGSIRFIDIFDNEVGVVSVSYADGLKAGASGSWAGARRFNRYLESHQALASLEQGQYTSRFDPEMIVFADGQKLVVKQ
ncbi:hypothetical protein [Propionivibrio sp.]|uniref:hypothetical protein n=1 Tax=Propionivibrio sp. TaxID=2212460 RepID=UPI003BF0FD5A